MPILQMILNRGCRPAPLSDEATLEAIEIPADGSPPHLISLTTRIKTYLGYPSSIHLLPDLQTYWGTEHNMMKADLRISGGPSFTHLNGHYVIIGFKDASMSYTVPQNSWLPFLPTWGDAVILKWRDEVNWDLDWRIYDPIPRVMLNEEVLRDVLGQRPIG